MSLHDRVKAVREKHLTHEPDPLEVTACDLCTENFLLGNMFAMRRRGFASTLYVCDGCREAIANATPCIGL